MPAVRVAGKSHRYLFPRRRTCERQGNACRTLGKQHWHTLVIPYPSSVVAADIAQMGCEQRIESGIRRCGDSRPRLATRTQLDKSNFLQNHIPMRVCEDFLFDPVSLIQVSVDQPVPRNAWFD